MSKSVHEQVLARVQQVLLNATDAGDVVDRGRPDPFSAREVPALNVRRALGNHTAFGRGVDHQVLQFEIDHLVRGDDWETQADALHMAVHQILLADVQLAALCKGLRCVLTEPAAQSGDETAGRLMARYEAQVLVRQADLTQQLN